uniref:Prepronociceptin n=1 Tax=Xenopus tropicalis TaxID=8364 RepID=A0A803JUH0_XENTR
MGSKRGDFMTMMPVSPTIQNNQARSTLCEAMMKALQWNIVLLCLLGHVLCDCQKDCMTCNKHLYQQDNFNTLLCIVECEGKIYSSSMWSICKTVLVQSSLQLSVDSVGGFQEDYKPINMEDGQFASNFKRLSDLTKLVDLNKMKEGKRLSDISDLIREQSEEDPSLDGAEGALGMAAYPDEFGQLQNPANAVSKRFGGFVKGKYSYRKFMGPSKDLQKRYGGFIGVRKSARKWNNQKRFSEFLRQYLGMSTRSAEYDSFTNDVSDINGQNEI